ncbi:M56 family metallopeptidase [Longibacter sp.]|jgi:TonB family protein|uniref:M56 family metallopeptidase n=1 Tax=Longibacter sp. TaxID=2045415 RepID=UPI003EB9BA7A
MMTMLEVLHDIGRATAHALWIPVGIWTVGAMLIDGLLRGIRPSPLVRYRVRQALLFALPISLIAGLVLHLPVSSAPVHDVASRLGTSVLSLPTVDVAGGTGSAIDWTHALGLLTIIALLCGIAGVVRLAVHTRKLCGLRRQTHQDASDHVHRIERNLRSNLGLTRPALLRISSTDVPMLVPGRPPHIVLPTWMAQNADEQISQDRLRMALAHELVHLQRYDDVSAIVERWVVAVGALHPLIRRLARSIVFDRETACDARVLSTLSCRRGTYARLLRDVATRSRPIHSVALSQSASTLQERLQAMTFSRPSPSSAIIRTLSIGVLSLLTIGIVACTDAPSGSPSTDAENPVTTSSSSDKPASPPSAVDAYPKIVGGLQAVQEAMQYPESAYEAGVEGRVLVQFVVDANGNVQEATIAQGVHDLLDDEALRVVRATDFTPGRQNGKAVPVEMTLPITFQHAESTQGTTG